MAIAKWTAEEKPKTDLAIISIAATVVGSFFVPVGGAILGLILAYKARDQARATGGRSGREDLARTAIVVGWVGLGITLLPMCMFPAILGGQMGLSLCGGMLELPMTFAGGQQASHVGGQSMWGTIIALFYEVLAIFATACLALLIRDRMGWGWFLTLLMAINIVTFLVYGFDKIFVRMLSRLRFRVPEKVLIWGLAFPGGTLGAWGAVLLLKHKSGSGKRAFRHELLKVSAIQVIVGAVLVFLFRNNIHQ